jgi:formylglycine-generating enzyme required for sulfatase activity
MLTPSAFRDRGPYSLMIGMALLAAALRGEGQPAAFYQLATVSNQPALNLSANGVLSATDTNPIGYFVIETKTNFEQAGWAPWARGTGSTTTVTLQVQDFSPPPGMLFIPAGYFTMGDILGDLIGLGTPVHTVYVSAVYLDRFEVTNEQMRQVMQWAFDNNKILISTNSVINTEGSPQELLVLNKYDAVLSFVNGHFLVQNGRTNNAAIWVTWYGAVAYCNYLSEMENLPVCYNLTNWACDFTANGYRLPTEAEWEKAARGGYEGHRFPWSDVDTITHSQANYNSSTNHSYDISPTRGYNPLAGTNAPQTMDVGRFAPNGYGLYDMAGNVWEWVWDWNARYTSDTQFDPMGPSTGLDRIFRGGSWRTTSERVTCAMRYSSSPPTGSFDDIGFRTARRVVQ